MAQQDVTLSVMQDEGSTQQALSPRGRIASILNKIHATKNMDDLFLELREDLRKLFDVEQLTLYAVDADDGWSLAFARKDRFRFWRRRKRIFDIRP